MPLKFGFLRKVWREFWTYSEVLGIYYNKLNPKKHKKNRTWT